MTKNKESDESVQNSSGKQSLRKSKSKKIHKDRKQDKKYLQQNLKQKTNEGTNVKKDSKRLQKKWAYYLKQERQKAENNVWKNRNFFIQEINSYFGNIELVKEYSTKMTCKNPKQEIAIVLQSNIQTIWEDASLNKALLPQFLFILRELLAETKNKPILLEKDGNKFALITENGKDSNLIEVSKLQYELISERKNLILSLFEVLKSYGIKVGEKGFDLIDLEILALLKAYCRQNDALAAALNNIVHRTTVHNQLECLVESNAENEQSSRDSLDAYIAFLMKKNLQATFDERACVNFLTYFAQRETIQTGESRLQPSSHQQFRQFLLKRKPVKGKKRKLFLRTACSVCFSDHFEQANPFWTCKCGFRIHKYCQQQTDICGKCDYYKIKLEQRSRVPQCNICFKKGLMNQRISSNFYYHSFCLLATDYKKVQQGSLRTVNSIQINQEEGKCYECNNVSPFKFLLSCVFCTKTVHAFCAFFAGLRINCSDQKFKVNCCIDSQLKDKLSRQRRFKLNICNEVYKSENI